MDEMIKIEYVRQIFLETSKAFRFNLIEPSPIELLSVLEAKSGPSIRDEIYQFKDKGDREVALRFDFSEKNENVLILNKKINDDGTVKFLGESNDINEINNVIEKKLSDLLEKKLNNMLENQLPNILDKYFKNKK